MQNCYLFCLCLSFRLKGKKRYLLWKRSQVFSAFEGMIFWCQYCPLFIHFSLYEMMFKSAREVPFFRFQAISWKAQKGTFFAVGSDVLKRAKKVPLIVFSSDGKPFRILLIDRCQLFGVIFMNFVSEFTNPLVKR